MCNKIRTVCQIDGLRANLQGNSKSFNFPDFDSLNLNWLHFAERDFTARRSQYYKQSFRTVIELC